MTHDPLYAVDESSHVLCPGLYRVLLQKFPGGVRIANQGESCVMTSRPKAGGVVYTAITHSGEYYRINCPYCRDTRYRLWVNHMFGQLDGNGREMRFLANCYNEDCLSKEQHRRHFTDLVLGFQNYGSRRQAPFAIQPGEWVDPTQMGVAEMPGQIIPMFQLAQAAPDHAAVDYLCRQRRYTQQMLAKYELGYCTYAPKYPAATNRIIIPIRMNGVLVGWQARYIGSTDWRTTPKYYGLPGMRKRMMLYNYDTAKNCPFVVVVEGATDAHVVGDPCVAILGKSLSTYQATTLLSTWPGKPIILIFDPEARDEMAKTTEELRDNGAVVVEIILPGENDCGDYDRRELWNIIYSQTAAMGVRLPQVA